MKNKQKIINTIFGIIVLSIIATFGAYYLNFSKASIAQPADINNDNKVDIFDLSMLLSNWNKTGANSSDINSDNVVNIFDLSILLSKWGPVTVATPSPTPVPSQWAGPSNTGYSAAPDYPGSLTTFTGTIQSNTTYKFMYFPGGIYVGDSSNHPINVTFYGCRFTSNSVLDANVAIYGDNISFDYSTFEPSAVSSAPVAYGKGFQYGIDTRYAGKLTIDHSNFWGFGEAMQVNYSSQAKPVTVSNSWFHDASEQGTNPATQYHVDGILTNDGGPSYMTFNHNTIVGDGDTNALALQSSGSAYDHITVTNNYFSGYGYMVNTGGHTRSTNMIFTGNVWGTDFEPGWGPLYGSEMYTTPGLGGLWRNNTISVKAGTTWMAAGNNGKYWWPEDSKPSSTSQIIGHTTDYTNP